METFEKYSFLPAQLNPYLIFNRGSRPRKAKILTTQHHLPKLRGRPQFDLPELRGKQEYIEYFEDYNLSLTPVPSSGATGQAPGLGIKERFVKVS